MQLITKQNLETIAVNEENRKEYDDVCNERNQIRDTANAKIEKLREAVKQECEQKVIAIEGALKLDIELTTLREREKALREALEWALDYICPPSHLHCKHGRNFEIARATLAATQPGWPGAGMR